MSNEIKNTLFRFVSMRAPELSSDFEENPGFVTDKGNSRGAFLDAVNNKTYSTKREALQNAAVTFAQIVPNTPSKVLDVEKIKALSIKMYEFSQWLSKNRFKATEAEIASMAIGVGDINSHMITLWNNLFYQVVTQKDFYAKELIMQLLLANHVVKETGIGTYKDRALAKIVLPKVLFVEDPSVNISASRVLSARSATEAVFANPVMQSLENQSVAQQNIEVLTRLQEELAIAEQAFRKEYQAAYDKEYSAYQQTIKPILDKYNEQVEDAKNQWCNVKDPNTVYNPNDPCQQIPSVPQPDLPEFGFSFTEEMDIKFLSNYLSSQSLDAYESIINPAEDEEETQDNGLQNRGFTFGSFSPGGSTFSSTSSLIAQLLNQNTNNYTQNTVNSGTTTVVIGGTTVAVPNTPSPLQPFEYEIKSRRSGFMSAAIRRLQIMVGIPDASWKITAVQYTMTRNDDTFVVKNSSTVIHHTGYDALMNLSMSGISANLKELSITFQFTNGQTATVVVPNFVLTSIYKGMIKFPVLAESEEEGTPGTPGSSTVDPEQHFIPTGFGLKQIGIADYNKVEQTIQGYVEGEVAHIENIMAREFKEKSTRRLSRREVTETSSSETEREQLTDTSTVDRFEMQSEVAKVIASSKDFSAGVTATYGDPKTFSMSASANFATNNSKEESARQAVTNAKEITERALDRIVSKVKEERIEKVLEEFEENNSHGFDNRKGDKHVVGVYRWVDKVFKNQIVNYGKRLMFEFSIPEPARLHNLAMTTLIDQKKAGAVPEPKNPRTDASHTLENYSQINDARLQYWSGYYNVEVKPMPAEYITVGDSFSIMGGGAAAKLMNTESISGNGKIKIPEGYAAINASGTFTASSDNDSGGNILSLTVGTVRVSNTSRWHSQSISFNSVAIFGFVNEVPVSYTLGNHVAGDITASVGCKLTAEAKAQWQMESFNAIMSAYEEALQKYNEDLAMEANNGVHILGSNPGFYREIENIILRKNCISYIISSSPNAKLTFGKDFYKMNNTTESKLTFENGMINNNADLDKYAAFVKFIEQAFEWEIMSYYFYPFYWANRNNWTTMYQYDQTHDHVFKAFMQSGMARVIVTVRPGFEEAVRYYMQTGQIWNGGEVPVIGDELFMSIVDEMRTTEGEKVGKAWPTRVPTSMTILQAGSIGLNVTKALPFNNEDMEDFEHPEQVPQSSQIEQNTAQVGTSNEEGVRHIENIDLNDGYLQLTTDDSPRQIVAQISVQALKNAIEGTTGPA
ncbi:MAG TPA: hypothetical protein VF602_07735 [Pedobacter sp.]|jgi:hypothetical protein